MVQKNEIRHQERLINDLVNAKTQAELDKINASMASSKAAQDASSNQVMKQKMEIDLEKMAMEMEKEKIQTARDEEEAEELRAASERVAAREAAYAEQFNRRIQAMGDIPPKINLLI